MRTDRPGRKRTTRPDRQAENQPLIHRGRTKPGRGPAWTAQPQADLPHTDGPRALGGPCLSPQMRPGTTKRGAFPSACQPYDRQREGRLEPFRRSRDGAEASRWLPDRTRRVYHRPSRAARTQQDPGHTVRASCHEGRRPAFLRASAPPGEAEASTLRLRWQRVVGAGTAGGGKHDLSPWPRLLRGGKGYGAATPRFAERSAGSPVSCWRQCWRLNLMLRRTRIRIRKPHSRIFRLASNPVRSQPPCAFAPVPASPSRRLA